MNANNDSLVVNAVRKLDETSKKKYHKPSIQVYGTLAQMTENTFQFPSVGPDSAGGPPSNTFRRT